MMMKLTRCEAIKIESNNNNFDVIKKLVKGNIPVMGHIGYTPQFKKKFKVEGSTLSSAKKLSKRGFIVQKLEHSRLFLNVLMRKLQKK